LIQWKDAPSRSLSGWRDVEDSDDAEQEYAAEHVGQGERSPSETAASTTAVTDSQEREDRDAAGVHRSPV
jgi:hypothetical protein